MSDSDSEEPRAVNQAELAERAASSDTVTVQIVKRFTLNLEDGGVQSFLPGTHELPPHIANHWFVKANSADAPPVEPKPGTRAYAEKQQELAAEKNRIDAAVKAALAEKHGELQAAAEEVRKARQAPPKE